MGMGAWNPSSSAKERPSLSSAEGSPVIQLPLELQSGEMQAKRDQYFVNRKTFGCLSRSLFLSPLFFTACVSLGIPSIMNQYSSKGGCQVHFPYCSQHWYGSILIEKKTFGFGTSSNDTSGYSTLLKSVLKNIFLFKIKYIV